MEKLLQPRFLSGAPSVFLDCIRIAAALFVVFGHAYDMWHFSPQRAAINFTIDDAKHASMVVFFVLSGFVIAHTTTRNHRDGLHYTVARLSRLYSVLLPAIFITALVQFIVWKSSPALNAEYVKHDSWIRYVMSSFFVNEIWFLSTAPPINGPLWSLCFEFWYYVIFGLFFYRLGKGILSFIFPFIACLIAGPKILVLMPVWLAGCFAYYYRPPEWMRLYSWAIVTVFLFLSLLSVFVLPHLPNSVGTAYLFWAAQFITDSITGFLLAVALCFLPTWQMRKPNHSKRSVKAIRTFADLTFTIYLLHMPLLILYRSVFGTRMFNNGEMAEAIFTVLLSCVLTGLVLEKYKYLWTILFTKLLYHFVNLKHKLIKPINTAS